MTTARALTNMVQLASAAFTEAHSAFAEGAEMPKDDAKPSRAYAFGMVASGLSQIEALSKQLVPLPESAPILADNTFRATVADCATSLDLLIDYVPSLKRVAASLRRLVEASNPAEARTLAMIADTIGRASKMAGARAA